MEGARRVGALAALVLLLSLNESSFVLGQSTANGRQPGKTATVVLAVDLREVTSLRDAPHVGDVFFRRIEQPHDRAGGNYDLAIRGSVVADWKGLFGGSDDNRTAHIFAVEPGTYVIEKINIGSGPTTVGPGIDAQTHAPRFGSFSVREGEVLNLGRLVVHMHWHGHEGYFDAKVEDNTAEARNAVANGNRGIAARLQTRLLKVTPKFPFQTSGGRL
jgi:hypothetical protein